MFMQLHREKIASKSLAFFFAIRAAWHGANALKIPSNISFLQLPPWRKRLPLPLYYVINNARRGPRSSSIKRALRTQQPKNTGPSCGTTGPQFTFRNPPTGSSIGAAIAELISFKSRLG